MLEKARYRNVGWMYLFMWALLIVAGIIGKRVYGHPDWMVFFHLPAAIFLVAAFRRLSIEFRLEVTRKLEERMRTRAKHYSDIDDDSALRLKRPVESSSV